MFLMPNRDLLICQHQLQTSKIWTLLSKLLLSVHKLWQGGNLNQHSSSRTAHMQYVSLRTTQHRTVLTIFHLILQTIIIVQTMSTGGKGCVCVHDRPSSMTLPASSSIPSISQPRTYTRPTCGTNGWLGL